MVTADDQLDFVHQWLSLEFKSSLSFPPASQRPTGVSSTCENKGMLFCMVVRLMVQEKEATQLPRHSVRFL